MRWLIGSLFGCFLLYALTVIPQTAAMFFDFGQEKSGASWRAVNDGVMGGLSKGQLHFNDTTAHFTGILSLENNGGFASMRSPKDDFDFSESQGFLLRVKTDGRTYTLSLNDTYYFNGVYYEQTFTTPPDTWMEIQFPIAQFTGTYFGNRTDQLPPFDPSQVKELGIVLKDKQKGPFSIEIDWLKVY